ncbi:uncharacterized protein LOC144445478 [Glandiceps talaboti]
MWYFNIGSAASGSSTMTVPCIVFVVVIGILLHVSHFTQGQGERDNNLRLADGETPFEGRVEVFYNGHWSTVCSDEWNMNVADFVCKSLGTPKGAMSLWSDPPRNIVSPAVSGIFHCSDSQTLPSECFQPNAVYEAMSDESQQCDPIGVHCNLPGYVGCMPYNENQWQKASCRHGDDVEHGKCEASISGCIHFCQYPSFTYAGLVNGNECHCLTASSQFSRNDVMTNMNCYLPCAGNENQVCGGRRHIGVYHSSMGACGGHFSSESLEGAIVSSGFPNNYPPNQDCVWVISQPQGTKIELTLTMLYLADPDDVIHFIEHTPSSGKSVTTILQGSQSAIQFPRTMMTRSNAVRIVFRSSPANQDRGFVIFYKAVPDETGVPVQPVMTTQGIEVGSGNGNIEDRGEGTNKQIKTEVDTGIAIGIVVAMVLTVVAVTLFIVLLRRRRMDKLAEGVIYVNAPQQNPRRHPNVPSPRGESEVLYAEIGENVRQQRLSQNSAGNGPVSPKYYTLEDPLQEGANGDIQVHATGVDTRPAMNLPGRDTTGRTGTHRGYNDRESPNHHGRNQPKRPSYTRKPHIYEEIPCDIDISEDSSRPLYDDDSAKKRKKRRPYVEPTDSDEFREMERLSLHSWRHNTPDQWNGARARGEMYPRAGAMAPMNHIRRDSNISSDTNYSNPRPGDEKMNFKSALPKMNRNRFESSDSSDTNYPDSQLDDEHACYYDTSEADDRRFDRHFDDYRNRNTNKYPNVHNMSTRPRNNRLPSDEYRDRGRHYDSNNYNDIDRDVEFETNIGPQNIEQNGATLNSFDTSDSDNERTNELHNFAQLNEDRRRGRVVEILTDHMYPEEYEV